MALRARGCKKTRRRSRRLGVAFFERAVDHNIRKSSCERLCKFNLTATLGVRKVTYLKTLTVHVRKIAIHISIYQLLFKNQHLLKKLVVIEIALLYLPTLFHLQASEQIAD